jgi:cation diffusion facilitator family transporter
MWITAVMMVVEVAAGWWFSSMALLADGWHMSSHALAIGLSALAYAASRRYATDPRFAFGTWKVEVLGGFASAVFLLGVAVMMLVESVDRLWEPQPIQYLEAIAVSVVGLAVNLVCAAILGRAQHDHDRHGHDSPDGGGKHADLNLRSAYVHVAADAATSILAILALLGGWWFGLSWLDPAMGIIGAILIAMWVKGLMIDAGKVLLDCEMDHSIVEDIRQTLEFATLPGQTRVTDLHVWRVSKQGYSCAITVVTRDAQLTAARLRQRLSTHPEVMHSTIEVHLDPITP